MWLIALFTGLVVVALFLPRRDGLRLWDRQGISAFVFILLIVGLLSAIARACPGGAA